MSEGRVERKIDFTRVAELSRKLELRNVHLYSSSFEVHSFPEERPKNSVLKFDVSFGGAVSDLSENLVNLNVLVNFRVSTSMIIDGAAQPVLDVRDIWRVIYTMKGLVERPSEVELDDLIFTNGQLNSFPYFRQHVTDLSARSGWPTLVLPVFRVPSVRYIDQAGRLVTSGSADPESNE